MPNTNGPDLILRPTRETYDAFQDSFEWLNRGLYDRTLPNCLITFQRRARSYGYFHSERFGNKDGQTTDEIALNPAHFRTRPAIEVLGTQAHEMTHLWQHHFGNPGKRGYHNREWADRMKAIGLQPTSTGEEGGRETGYKMHHLIIPGGPFEKAALELIESGFEITWVEVPRKASASAQDPEAKEEEPESKSGKRVTYICPQEHEDRRDKVFRAWSSHDAELRCGRHNVPMVPA